MLSLFPVLAIALVVVAIGAAVLTTLRQDRMRGAFAVPDSSTVPTAIGYHGAYNGTWLPGPNAFCSTTRST